MDEFDYSDIAELRVALNDLSGATSRSVVGIPTLRRGRGTLMSISGVVAFLQRAGGDPSEFAIKAGTEMTEQELLRAALAKSVGERSAYLDRQCSGNPQLRAAVESLLANHLASAADLAETRDSHRTIEEPAATHDPFAFSEAISEIGMSQGPTRQHGRDAVAGSTLDDRYLLQEKIGEGGMGEVWIAQQIQPVKRKVALKLIKTGMDSRAVLQRFEQERQALALMDHPNIARVLDGGITRTGQPFFVMELVHGKTLTKYCDEARLTPAQRLELFVPICHAVQHAHQKGIVHRDLKPANILVATIDSRPVPKVIDFGVAKATAGKLTDEALSTQFGAVVGTLEYMSPEQAGFIHGDIDTRADIYSLGVILYELLTGLRPIDAQRLKKVAFTEMIRLIQEEDPSKPSTKLSTNESLPSLAALRQTEPKKLMSILRGELDWIVMKCLEKQRDRRYETANALARDVQRYLANETVEARPPSATYRLNKFIKRHKGQVTAVSLVVLALVAGTCAATWGMIEAQRQKKAAQVQEQMARSETREKEKALRAEAERAEGERLAKLDAEAKRQEAETNLQYARKGNEILGSVFENLDPDQNYATVAELRDALKANLKQAAEDLEGSSIGDPLAVAAMQNKLGLSLYSLGITEPSIPLFLKARDTLTAQLGPENSETLVANSNLAAAYVQTGNLDLGVPLSERTLEQTKRLLGPENEQTLRSMNNTAKAYVAAGRLSQALPLCEDAYRIKKDTLGPNHPSTLKSMATLASVYRQSGKLDLAVPLLEQAIQLIKTEFGTEHPFVIQSIHNLALSYKATGKVAQAIPLYEEALQLLKDRLGQEHPDTLTSMSNLGAAYREVGKMDLALPLLVKALELRKSTLGAEHADTLNSMNNLAMAYKTSGKLDLALPLYMETSRILDSKLGADHPNSLVSANNLALAHMAMQRLDLAVPLLEKVLDLRRSKLGPEHPSTLNSMNSLITAYEAVNKKDLSLKVQRELLEMSRKVLPADHPRLAEILSTVSASLLNDESFVEAESLLRELLALCETSRPDSWQYFDTQSLLGRSLLAQKKYAEAEPLLLAGYAGLKLRETKIPKPVRESLSSTVDLLVELYEATERPEGVSKWRAERAKYQSNEAAPDGKP